MLVFAALARARGVRGAARALGTPRSTVSRKLAELEAAVGMPLVVRTARRFDLTEVGVQLAHRCEELEALLRASEDLVRSGSSEPSGTLRVAVAPVLGEEILPTVVAQLLQRHPRLSIDARLSVDYVDLRRGVVDVALRAAVLDEATDLFAVRLGSSLRGLYASPAYLASRGTPRTPADLRRGDCILVGPEVRVAWVLRSGAREVKVPVTGRLRVDNFRVARDAAANGAGIVNVTAVFAEPLVQRGELVPVLERYWSRVDIFAVHAGPNPPAAHVRAFIEAARQATRTALPGEAGGRWRSA
jgi:DNA-binding transcriptional LysR family regulator